MHVLVAMGEAKNDPSTVAYGLARAWSLAGVPVLMIDVDPAGCTLDFRLGNAVRMNLDPIARGLPSLVGGNHPFSVETIAKHTYGLSGNSNLWLMLGPAHPKGSQLAAEYVSENLADLQELAGNLKVVVNAGRIPPDMPINPAVRPLIGAAEPLLVVDSFVEEDGTNFLSRIGVDRRTPADDLFTEDADGEMVPSFMDEIEEFMGEIPPGDFPGKKAKTRGKKAKTGGKKTRARGKKAKTGGEKAEDTKEADDTDDTETSVALRKDTAARKETAKRKKKKSYELLIVADGNLAQPETVEIRVLSRIPALPDLRALAKPRGGQAKKWNAGIVEATKQIDLMFVKEDLSEGDSLDLDVAPSEKIPKVVEVEEVKDTASWWRRRRGRSDADIVDLEVAESGDGEDAESGSEESVESGSEESLEEELVASSPEVLESSVEEALAEFVPGEDGESGLGEEVLESVSEEDVESSPGEVLAETAGGEAAVGKSRSRRRVKEKKRKKDKKEKRKKGKPASKVDAGKAGEQVTEGDLPEESALDSEEESVEEASTSSTDNSTSDGQESQEKGEKDAGNR